MERLATTALRTIRAWPGGRFLLRADPSVEDAVMLGDAGAGKRPGPSEVHCAPDLVSHRGLGHVRAFGRVPLALDTNLTVQREDLAALSIEELAEQLAAFVRSLIAALVEAAADREVVEGQQVDQVLVVLGGLNKA
jgi:hypothetical protein